MELIRPLYFVREEDIISWKNKNNLDFIQCACRFTEEYEKNNNKNDTSKREKMKLLIKELKKDYENIDVNIFSSVQNVNLDTIISYKKQDKIYHFLDTYNDKLEDLSNNSNKNI